MVEFSPATRVTRVRFPANAVELLNEMCVSIQSKWVWLSCANVKSKPTCQNYKHVSLSKVLSIAKEFFLALEFENKLEISI